MTLTLARVSLVLPLLLAADSARAGAWVQQEFEGFYKAGGRLVRASSYYQDNGERVDIATLTDYTISVYGEFGITERLTGILYFPFFRRLTFNRQIGRQTGTVYSEGEQKTGIGDLDLSLRLKLADIGQAVISGEFKMGFPTGSSSKPNNELVRTGDGEFNGRVSILVGYSLHPLPAYATVGVGFNKRTRGYSDEFRYSIEAGWTFFDDLTVLLRLSGLHSLRNKPGGKIDNNQRYMSFQPEIAYAFTDWLGATFAVDLATLGRNVVAAPAFSLGMFAKL